MLLCTIDQFFEAHPDEAVVFHWSRMLACTSRRAMPLSEMMGDVLRFFRHSSTLQIAYLNTCVALHHFDLLCAMLRECPTLWAINLGETMFSSDQCAALIQSIRASRVAFMFVDAVYVGEAVVQTLKAIIRTRRREAKEAPWLLTDETTDAQRAVVLRCGSMWWAPWCLGRNKAALEQRRHHDHAAHPPVIAPPRPPLASSGVFKEMSGGGFGAPDKSESENG